MFTRAGIVAVLAALSIGTSAWCLDLTSSFKRGDVELQSAGPISFGPQGILFVGDPKAAAVFAIATGDANGNPAGASHSVDGIDAKVAAALGTTADGILISDMGVNPHSGNAYLSVSRGRGPDADAVILRLRKGELSEVSLNAVRYAKADLPNPPPPGSKDRRDRDLRVQSITDLAYFDGRLLVAGLSNEEFASTLRSIPFPFQNVDGGTSVEIYHGAHGKYETRSPVRTFATYHIHAVPYLLAAYTCTPLVKFPLSDLAPGKKVQGTTIAELGNQNRPLDMIIYERDGADYILMANNRRGVMKIDTDKIDRDEGITERIGKGGTAGQAYETIDELQGVVQLDRLNRDHALVLMQSDGDKLNLRTVALP